MCGSVFQKLSIINKEKKEGEEMKKKGMGKDGNEGKRMDGKKKIRELGGNR